MTFVIGIADDITCIRHGAGYTVGLEVHLVHHILDAFAELVIIAQSVTDVQLQILKRFPFQVSVSILCGKYLCDKLRIRQQHYRQKQILHKPWHRRIHLFQDACSKYRR